jgi:uncharacterized protein YeaO (DUF488 family)
VKTCSAPGSPFIPRFKNLGFSGSLDKYRDELRAKRELIVKLKLESKGRTVTLLYSAKDIKHNNAIVLKDVLD